MGKQKFHFWIKAKVINFIMITKIECNLKSILLNGFHQPINKLTKGRADERVSKLPIKLIKKKKFLLFFCYGNDIKTVVIFFVYDLRLLNVITVIDVY